MPIIELLMIGGTRIKQSSPNIMEVYLNVVDMF